MPPIDFDLWSQKSDAMRIFLVETSAMRIADGYLLPLYFATQTVVLEDRCYLGTRIGLPRLSRQANDILSPNHVSTWGELELAIEPDYRPDAYRSVTWLELLSPAWNLRDQPLIILMGGEGFAYSDFKPVFTGRVGNYNWDDSKLTLTIYDKTKSLDITMPDYELPDSPQVVEESYDQTVPAILGKVNNFKPILITTTNPGAYPWKYALSCHVMQALDAVNGNNSPTSYAWIPKDVFPARKDGEGSAIMYTFGPYTGSLLIAEWVVQIDSITALNSAGNSGPEVGLATFRWKLEGDAAWRGEGILTWKLAYDSTTLIKSPTAGLGVMAVSGDYTGDCKLSYKTKITRAGDIGDAICPQFTWSDDGGLTWKPDIDILDTGPIPLNRGLSVAFSGVGGLIPSTSWVPANYPPAPGVMSWVAWNAADEVEVEIDTGGMVGSGATFKWTDDGWATSTTLVPILNTSPIELFPGFSVQFSHPGGPVNEYDVGDAGVFTWVYQPAFVVDDLWTWTFKEIPVPLADGLSVQFATQTGDDFVLGDGWRFILGSALLLPGVGEGVNITVDGRGLISPALGVYSDLIGEMIRAVLVLWAKWDAVADFDLPALAAFNAAFPYQAGLIVDSPTAIAAIIDRLLTGLPALYTTKNDGRFFLAEIAPLTGEPILELTDVEFIQAPEGADGDDNLYRRVYLNYDRNPNADKNPQGALSQERVEWLRREFRQVSVRDETVVITYPWATDLKPLDTCLVQRADAQALAYKVLNLLKVKHPRAKIVCKNQAFHLDLGDEVGVRRSRFGITEGLVCEIHGSELNFTTSEAILSLWR